MPFEFEPSARLPGLILVKPALFYDRRGYFLESYEAEAFGKAGIVCSFVQENQSLSQKNVLRGIHLQRAPAAQAKLVRCVAGTIWDVAVDLRPRSPFFKQWQAFELSAANGWQLYIPEGFGHAFCALTDNALALYLCSAPYAPQHQCSIRYDDPDLKIGWPVAEPILSEKDALAPFLAQARLE